MNDQSRTYYDEENNIIYNTKVLKSNVCDFNDAHILVRGDITIIGHAETLTIFLLSKTQKYLFLPSLYQQETTKIIKIS